MKLYNNYTEVIDSKNYISYVESKIASRECITLKREIDKELYRGKSGAQIVQESSRFNGIDIQESTAFCFNNKLSTKDQEILYRYLNTNPKEFVNLIEKYKDPQQVLDTIK